MKKYKSLKDLEPFVERAMNYFGMKLPLILKKDMRISDIACIVEDRVILLGKKFWKDNRREQEKKIIHELLHFLGLEDNIEELEYYSDPKKDNFSRRVYEHFLKNSKFDNALINPVGGCTKGRRYLHEHIDDPSKYDTIRTVISGEHRIRIGYSLFDPKTKRHKEYGLVSILHPFTKEEEEKLKKRGIVCV